MRSCFTFFYLSLHLSNILLNLFPHTSLLFFPPLNNRLGLDLVNPFPQLTDFIQLILKDQGVFTHLQHPSFACPYLLGSFIEDLKLNLVLRF